MHIALTFNLQEDYPLDPDTPPDANAEYDTEESIRYLEDAIAAAGHDVRRIGDVRKLVRFLDSGGTADLVFNMAEGRYGRAREAQIPALLEAYRIPYTGSDPLTLALCLDKAAIKRLWQHARVPTAPFAVADRLDALHGLALPPYPLMVKPLHEGTSKGIDAASTVNDPEALRAQVARVLRVYHQPAIIEAFLPGREFSVGILGTGSTAQAIGVTEILLPATSPVVGVAEKYGWDTTVEGAFAPVPNGPLRDTLAALALRAYRVAECRDLGRVDLRLDGEGQAHVLEINPIVGLHPHSSVMPILAYQAGYSFETLIGAIIDHALERLGHVNLHAARTKSTRSDDHPIRRSS